MSGFNVPNTEYRTRMQYYELLDIVNQRKVYNLYSMQEENNRQEQGIYIWN